MVRGLQLVTLLVVTAWTVGGLVVDQHVGHAGQLALGVFTIGVLAALLAAHPTEVRVQTLAVVAIATVGEVIGSLVWGLYTYRLDNLPAFVPPGHGLVYLAGLSLATVLADRSRTLLLVAGAVAATWGIAGVTVLAQPDVSGTIGCAFLIGVLVWARRPVYAGVFMVVVGLELYGTAVGTWTLGAVGARPRSLAGKPAEWRRERVRRLRRSRARARRAALCRRSGASVEEGAEVGRVDDGARPDQLARGVDLAPDVPEQESARPALAVDVGDDALAVRLGPFGDRVEA